MQVMGVKDVGVGLMRDSASFAGTSRWLRRLSHESRRLIGTGAKEKFPCQGREIPAQDQGLSFVGVSRRCSSKIRASVQRAIAARVTGPHRGDDAEL